MRWKERLQRLGPRVGMAVSLKALFFAFGREVPKFVFLFPFKQFKQSTRSLFLFENIFLCLFSLMYLTNFSFIFYQSKIGQWVLNDASQKLAGLLNRRFLSRLAISAMSVSVREKPKTSKFSFIRWSFSDWMGKLNLWMEKNSVVQFDLPLG